jgi:dynein heavy chain 2
LSQLLHHRTGVEIVGPSGCGKTTAWKVVADSYGLSGKRANIWYIIPKAGSLDTLLRVIDPDTREWTDGAITKASPEASKISPDEIGLIIADGDVDPVWIESLNSVLDDNRLLTLSTGERIQFGPNVKFIFETHRLEFASPVTVYRVGVIFINPSDFDVNLRLPQLTSLLSKLSQDLFSKLVPKILGHFKALLKIFVFPITEYGLLCNIIPLITDPVDEQDFVISFCRSIAILSAPKKQESVAFNILKVCQKSGLNIGSISNPLSVFYDSESESIKNLEYSQLKKFDPTCAPFIETPESLQI